MWWRPRWMCRNDSARERWNLSRNGEILLRLQVSFSPGQSINPIRMFTLREILEATNTSMAPGLSSYSYYNYNWGVVDGRRVTIKCMNPSSGVPPNSVAEALITEIAILSNIHHRNVVRVVGCCLETPAPLLVHEFIVPDGSLGDHLDRWERKRVETPPMSTRLRIAIDVADALNYIHSFTSRPIVHKDVRAGNILLDEDYNAKLFDFSLSVAIPSGQTHVEMDSVIGTLGYMDPEYYNAKLFDTGAVSGTVGYIDPEYLSTGVVTEKADVYAFGVLLIELLRGVTFLKGQRECDSFSELLAMGREVTQEPPVNRVEFTASEEYLALKEEFLVNLVGDAAAALGDAEGEADHIRAVAELALQCARLTAHERPTMKEVTQELRRIRSYVAPHLACTRGARYAGL